MPDAAPWGMPVTVSEPEEAALLAAARAGDAAAVEALLARYQAQIHRFGLKMCRDPQDAEDVLQETMIAMARGVRDFRGASSLSTWLYAVARSFCVKKRRRSRFAPTLLSADGREAEQVRDPGRAPDEQLAGKEVERALEAAIRDLEPMYREALVLRDVEGLTAPEVAEVLGITPQAVKSRLHRARVAVRDAVAPALGLPPDVPATPGRCPDVLALFSRHLEDQISAEVCQAMERHLAECPRCRTQCDSLRQTLALCHTSGRGAEVPAAVQSAVRSAVRRVIEARR